MGFTPGYDLPAPPALAHQNLSGFLGFFFAWRTERNRKEQGISSASNSEAGEDGNEASSPDLIGKIAPK